jgi:hypothetical protein
LSSPILTLPTVAELRVLTFGAEGQERPA